jgi:hypothetical protein
MVRPKRNGRIRSARSMSSRPGRSRNIARWRRAEAEARRRKFPRAQPSRSTRRELPAKASSAGRIAVRGRHGRGEHSSRSRTRRRTCPAACWCRANDRRAPASSSAGMVIRPPPPAIESTKPATKAAVASRAMISGVNSNMVCRNCPSGWRYRQCVFAQAATHASSRTRKWRRNHGRLAGSPQDTAGTGKGRCDWSPTIRR